MILLGHTRETVHQVMGIGVACIQGPTGTTYGPRPYKRGWYPTYRSTQPVVGPPTPPPSDTPPPPHDRSAGPPHGPQASEKTNNTKACDSPHHHSAPILSYGQGRYHHPTHRKNTNKKVHSLLPTPQPATVLTPELTHPSPGSARVVDLSQRPSPGRTPGHSAGTWAAPNAAYGPAAGCPLAQRWEVGPGYGYPQGDKIIPR